MAILWVILIGFVAGLIARYLVPGPNNPSGFILTVVLGIAGSFLATSIGQAIGWYRPDQGAGFIAATVGAALVLFAYAFENKVEMMSSNCVCPLLAQSRHFAA